MGKIEGEPGASDGSFAFLGEGSVGDLGADDGLHVDPHLRHAFRIPHRRLHLQVAPTTVDILQRMD